MSGGGPPEAARRRDRRAVSTNRKDCVQASLHLGQRERLVGPGGRPGLPVGFGPIGPGSNRFRWSHTIPREEDFSHEGVRTGMQVPETKYAKSGEVHIAYQQFGSGSVDIVFVPGWAPHIDLAWEGAAAARFLERLGRFSRVL